MVAIRRDWTTLSQYEKDEFGRGVNMLKANGEYDHLVRTHIDAFETATPWMDESEDTFVRNGMSMGPSFFPWHRQMLILFERQMQAVLRDETWGIPYWNFVEDGYGEPKLNEIWSDSGIGSNGRASDGVVVDGPFANWTILHNCSPNNDSHPPEQFLTRNLGLLVERPSNPNDLDDAYAQTTYDCFPYSSNSTCGFRTWASGLYGINGSQSLVGSLHTQAHLFIGESMMSCSSPNDPAFYLLHSFTDGIWFQWQNAQLEIHPGSSYLDAYEPQNNGPYFHNLHDPMVRMYGVTPAMVLAHEDLDYMYDGNLPRVSRGSDIANPSNETSSVGAWPWVVILVVAGIVMGFVFAVQARYSKDALAKQKLIPAGSNRDNRHRNFTEDIDEMSFESFPSYDNLDGRTWHSLQMESTGVASV